MFDFLFKSPAWQLIAQSDWMSKLVLLALFLMSVACIAIIAFKWVTLKNEKKNLDKLFDQMRSAKTFQEIVGFAKEYQDCICNKFLSKNLAELKTILEKNPDQKLSENDLESIELYMNQTIDSLLLEAEHYLPILGTSAAVSPLMGLFGTIWGLIHAFVNISQEKSADIAVVAPGIAEALTTTLGGLIVAIPAMIAFHYYSNELRKMEQQLVQISENFLKISKHTFVK
jgi:biopolymer transport protein TolQ